MANGTQGAGAQISDLLAELGLDVSQLPEDLREHAKKIFDGNTDFGKKLKEGSLRLEDYTKKTQEVAGLRTTLSQEIADARELKNLSALLSPSSDETPPVGAPATPASAPATPAQADVAKMTQDFLLKAKGYTDETVKAGSDRLFQWVNALTDVMQKQLDFRFSHAKTPMGNPIEMSKLFTVMKEQNIRDYDQAFNTVYQEEVVQARVKKEKEDAEQKQRDDLAAASVAGAPAGVGAVLRPATIAEGATDSLTDPNAARARAVARVAAEQTRSGSVTR